MGKLINFPSIVENNIRLNNATHWISSEDNYFFTANAPYQLMFNDWTEEYYVLDDQGYQNYSYYLLPGEFAA